LPWHILSVRGLMVAAFPSFETRGPGRELRMDITELLVQWNEGDETVIDRLTPIVYDELLRLARIKLRVERANLTLQPTALVHEVYLRLIDQTRFSWQNRSHFCAIAANIMRRILIDDARRRKAGKRGGGVHITLHEEMDAADERPADVLALDLALQALARIDERKSRVIELKYFGGLTTEEIAQVTGTSVATIGRDLRLAHAWLHREMDGAGENDREPVAADRRNFPHSA
jgi:RNA polymerase sigma-70 factor (ECF subfamily)